MRRTIVEIREGRSSGPISSFIQQANIEQLNPFVLWDHFRADHVSGTAGFGFHGHSGVATISAPFIGSISHEDTGGHSGTLLPQGIQVMSSGAGVLHKETVHPEEGTAEAFQLWTLLPSDGVEMGEVTYTTAQRSEIPLVESAGTHTRILIGTHQHATSPVQHSIPITYMHVLLEPGSRWLHQTAVNQTAGLVYVRSGSVSVSDSQLQQRQLGVLNASSETLEVVAGSSGAELMIALGQPLDQSILSSGPSVHSTLENLQSGTSNIRKLTKALQQTLKQSAF